MNNELRQEQERLIREMETITKQISMVKEEPGRLRLGEIVSIS